MTITLRVNIINRQMTPFFSSNLRAFISFLYFKNFKIQFHWIPTLYYVLVCKIHIYMLQMTLSSQLTEASFFYRKFFNFWSITCFVPNLIPIWCRLMELSKDRSFFFFFHFRFAQYHLVVFAEYTTNTSAREKKKKKERKTGSSLQGFKH